MKNICKILLFFVYLFLVFYVTNIYILIALVILSSCFAIICKINIIVMLKKILILVPFVIFTFLINCVLTDFMYATILGIRLIIVYITTYIFLKSITIKEISEVVEKIFSSISFIKKYDVKQISLIIAITMSLLPNVLSELRVKYYSIKSKTIRVTLKDMYILIRSMFISILIKLSEYENALILKGYHEE